MRMMALIKRICQQMFRDKRTLALLFLAPLLVLSLMYFLFNGNTVNPKVGVAGADAKLVQKLHDMDVDTKEYTAVKDAEKTIADDHLDAVLQRENGNVTLTLQNADPSKTKALQMKIQQALAAEAQQNLAMQVQAAHIAPPKAADMKTHYVYGNKNTSFFDVLSPILVGFFVFFFVFLISGIGLLRERTTGTLERLMSTPIRRGEIVAGYLVGYGLFAIIQTIIVVLYAVNVLDIVLVGSIWNVLLINLLLALVALSLGILLSSFAASEFQMIQFIPIVVIPQVFFTGIFPFESMPGWLQAIAKIMPLYYAGNALKDVMYKGMGLGDISGNLLALAIFAVIFIVLNVLALKKYRTL